MIDDIARVAKAVRDPASTQSRNQARLSFLEEWGALGDQERSRALVDPLVFAVAKDFGVAVPSPDRFVRERLLRDLDELAQLVAAIRQGIANTDSPSLDDGAHLLNRSAQVFEDISTLWHLSRG